MQSLDLCGPDPRPITRDEGLALSKAVKQLPIDPVIVQIGAYWGVSAAVMLETRPDIFIFSIDKNICPDEQYTLIAQGLDYTQVVRVLGYSAEIGKYWPYKCDLLFVDGDHTRKGIKDDCDVWLHKTDRVIFHDYIKDHPRSKVYEVVNEIFGNQEPYIRVDSMIGFEL